VIRRLTFVLAALGAALAQDLPDGPGRAEVEKLCKQCHEIARSVSLRQDREGWGRTMAKMGALGMKSSDHEFRVVLEYLAKNYPADEVPKVNVNRATAIQLESGLSLRRSEAAAVLAHRAKHGEFKSIDDLKRIEGVDPAKFEAKKDRIAF